MHLLKNKKGLARIHVFLSILLIVLLIGMSIPKVMDILAKTKEGRTSHNLMRLRSAIAAYYGDNKGQYPEGELKDSLVPNYIEFIPYVFLPGYENSNKVHNVRTNTGGWYYVNERANPDWGEIKVNVDIHDYTGKKWEEN